MAETEESALNFQIFTDIRDTREKIKTLTEDIKKLQQGMDEAKKSNKALSESQISSFDKMSKTLEGLQKFYNSGAIKNFRTVLNLMNGRTADGKFASHGKWLNSLSENMKAVGQVTSTVRQEAEGLAAALERARSQGENLKQIFGTDWGRASTRIRQAKDYINRQAEVAHWNEDAYKWYANFRQTKFYTLNGTKTGQAYQNNQLQSQYWQQQAYNDNYNPDLEKRFEQTRARVRNENRQEYVRWNNLSEEEKEAEKLANQQEKLNKRLGTTQLMVMSNYWVINRLAGAYKALINYTIQYDEELHQLQAISAMSNASLETTRKTIEEVAVSTEFTSLELAKASTVLAQAGLSATQIQGTLPAIAKLATATGTDLATATDTITSTMNVYSLQLSEAEHVTNALTTAMNESKATIPGFQTAIQYAGNFAAQLGMSFEETAAAISAATQAGIRSKSMLGTGMRAVLTEFLKPTDKLVAQLEKVGLTVDDIDVRTKGYVNVLKTLKAAGFGAAEAFQGMERRGAAFLAAQINQTDFMDELRLKMAGSTAASKANETQMQALAKQIKNFQNVLGTAATQGLTPFIQLLSELLQVVNALSQTKLGGGIFSLLLTGGGAFATIKSWQMIYGSLRGVIKGLGLLTGAGLSERTIQALTRLKKGDVDNWTKLGVAISRMKLGFAGWATVITTAISLIYQLGDAFDLWTSKNELLLRQFEEFKGKQEDLKSESEIINEYLAKLATQREKYSDPTEIRILAQEIMSRIPNASKYIDGMTDSVDSLREALYKLKGVNIGETAENAKKIAETSVAEVREASESAFNIRNKFGYVSRKDARGLYEALTEVSARAAKINGEGLDVARILAGGNSSNTKRYQEFIDSGDTKGLLDFFQSRPSANPRIALEFTRQLEALSDSMKDSSKSTFELNKDLSNLTSLGLGKTVEQLAGPLSKVTSGFRAWLDSIGKADAVNVFDKWKDIVKDTSDAVQKQYQDVQYEVNLIKARGGAVSLTEADQAGFESTYTSINNIVEALSKATNPKDRNDIKDLLILSGKNEDEANEILKGIETKDDLTTIGKHLAETELFPLLSQMVTLLATLTSLAAEKGWGIKGMATSVLEESHKSNLKQIDRAKSKGAVANLKEQDLKVIQALEDAAVANSNKRKDSAEYIAATKKAEDEITKNEELAKAASAKLTQDLEEAAASRMASLSRGDAKIDPLGTQYDLFFNKLDTDIKKITTTYREAEKALDQALAKQEGYSEAVNRFYGSNSVIAQAASIEEKNLKESQLWERQANLVAQRDSLVAQRKQMEGSDLFKKASEYMNTEKAYESALLSGNTTEALKYQQQLKKASSNEKKMATKYDELIKSINDLDETIQKNEEIIRQLRGMGNAPIGEQISTGLGAAATVYTNGVEEQGLHTLAGSTAYLASGVIDEIDSGFTTMFKDIISNSKSAGDAFKAFGRQVLETIRDIAIQMAVKQGISMLLSSFMSPTTGDITGNNLQYGQSSGNLTFLGTIGRATGGIVNGPIKNRDSVPAKLMPGEYVLKKSAVDVIGRDYLDSLNSNAAATLNASAVDVNNSREASNSDSSTSSSGGTVNVYVVGQEQQQAMTPSDVLVTITQDMLTGGQTKRLVKSIAMGAI